MVIFIVVIAFDLRNIFFETTILLLIFLITDSVFYLVDISSDGI